MMTPECPPRLQCSGSANCCAYCWMGSRLQKIAPWEWWCLAKYFEMFHTAAQIEPCVLLWFRKHRLYTNLLTLSLSLLCASISPFSFAAVSDWFFIMSSVLLASLQLSVSACPLPIHWSAQLNQNTMHWLVSLIPPPQSNSRYCESNHIYFWEHVTLMVLWSIRGRPHKQWDPKPVRLPFNAP